MVARPPASVARSGQVGARDRDEVACHVWVELVGPVAAASDGQASTAPDGLTPGEVRRWSAYRQPADRARFAAGVALQHRALVELTGVDAPLVRSCPGCGRDEHGPVSPGGELTGRVSMSLSHSGRLVVVALALTGPPGRPNASGTGCGAAATERAAVRVGVDVESCRSRRDGIEDLVGAPAESAADAAEPDPGCALMTRWTRKEAVLKAMGVGLMVPMTHVTVSPASQPPRVVAVTGHPGLAGLSPTTAHLADLVHPLLGDEYHASVCVVGPTGAPVVLHGPGLQGCTRATTIHP